MRLLLLRHGIAIDHADPECPAEHERFLTDEGIEKTREAARGLAQLNLKPTLVLSSPYKRARQTAEIAAEALGLQKVPLKTSAHLVPEGEPQKLFEELARHDAREILCAGHAPNLDRVLAHALGSERTLTGLKKAGAALLELSRIDPPRGELLWLATAKMLRQLAK